jgi:hypothetical protein
VTQLQELNFYTHRTMTGSYRLKLFTSTQIYRVMSEINCTALMSTQYVFKLCGVRVLTIIIISIFHVP